MRSVAGESRGLAELGFGEVGTPDLSHLALGDELLHRAESLAEGDSVIGEVQLVEVDGVDAEARQ